MPEQQQEQAGTSWTTQAQRHLSTALDSRRLGIEVHWVTLQGEAEASWLIKVDVDTGEVRFGPAALDPEAPADAEKERQLSDLPGLLARHTAILAAAPLLLKFKSVVSLHYHPESVPTHNCLLICTAAVQQPEVGVPRARSAQVKGEVFHYMGIERIDIGRFEAVVGKGR